MNNQLNSQTKEWIKGLLKTENGDTEKLAKWMARNLKVAGVKQCREWIKEATQS
jgi:hypothetical protein